jgi:hypothetical protein
VSYITWIVWAQEGSSFDVSAISEVIGLRNGWFVAVVGMVFIAYLMLRGQVVSRKTVDNQIEILKEALNNEQESRELWQKSAIELLQTSDLERENSRHMLTVVETTLKIVTDLQAARNNISKESDGR